MFYEGSGAPAINPSGAYTGIYQVPGISAAGDDPNTLQVPYSIDGSTMSLTNVPYIVNGSAVFNETGLVPQFNDW